MSGGGVSLAHEEARQRVHEVLQSPGWSGRWLGLLDDLPAPAELVHISWRPIRRYTERAFPITLTDRQDLLLASSSTEEAGLPESPSDCYTGTLQDVAVRSIPVLNSARTISMHFNLWKQHA